MLFNSTAFLIFFPCVFVLYWFVFKRTQQQNILLLISSYFFYGWWDWRFLSLILISSVSDYIIGLKLQEETNQKIRKRYLWASLAINLGILGTFKYFNFFIDSLTHLLATLGFHVQGTSLNIILPVGISFYTFQTLSYTIDIFKKELKPTRDIVSFFTYVAFFPQLVAGPIERARNLLPQFEKPRSFDYDFAVSGMRLMVLGFFKKVVIADSLAVLVDPIYSNPTAYSGAPLLLATLLFAIQIYCDFSGYSDIAIGLSRVLGFDLMTNFRSPYFSRSLTTFWRRWHISLSTWFRDYLYVPLGGSKKGTLRTYLNLLITFVVSGLWHGADWTFIAWGATHGVFLMIERLLSRVQLLQKVSQFSLLTGILTFVIVSFSWIFFRSNHLSDAIYIINNIFNDYESYSSMSALELNFRGMGVERSRIVYITYLCVLFFFVELVHNIPGMKSFVFQNTWLRWTGYFILVVLIISEAARNTASNFIYFQF